MTALTSRDQSQSPNYLEKSSEEGLKAWSEHAENPYNWPERRKWTAFLTVCTVTLLLGLNPTGIATPSEQIADAFHVQYDSFPNDYWPISSWGVGAMLGPMFFLPLLENFGFRYGYLVLYAVSVIFIIPSAVAQNFATLVATRFIVGAASGSVLNAPENVIQDVWATDAEKNLPVALFILSYMIGVTLGPIFGAIAAPLSWRWISYIQLIIYGVLFPILCILIPETRGPVIRARLLKRRGLVSLRTPSPNPSSVDSALAPISKPELSATTSVVAADEPPLATLFYSAIIRPFQLLLAEPVVTSFTLWSGLSFGLVFISTQSIPLVFPRNYGFTTPQNGLLQTSLLVGEVLGFFACLPQNAHYLRSASRNKENPGQPIPEARLTASIPASLFGLCGGLFWYAFASTPVVHWAVPAAGLILVGAGIEVIVTTAVMYMTDCYGIYAASAIAALAFGENICGAFVPLATKRMYHDLGMQWGGAVLGFVALGLTAAPVILWAGGGGWVRERSRFMRRAREDTQQVAGEGK